MLLETVLLFSSLHYNKFLFRFVYFSLVILMEYLKERMGVTRTFQDKNKYKKKKNSVALVRKRTIPYRTTAAVGEVSDNFLRIEGVAWSAQRIPTAVNSSVF
jgi:hypothetical protein